MSNEHPDYPEILVRRNSLTKLIKNLNIIANEDSMQTLAHMTDEQRNKVVEDFINKEEEAKKKKEEEEKEQQVNQIFNQDPTNLQKNNDFNKAGGSSWYFYNPQAIAFGTNEFQHKWGNRKLEDNWRRSNKQSSVSVEDENGTETATKTAEKKKEIKDPKEARAARKKELLEKIPSTPEALQKSTTKVVDAYYNAGMIYNEQLNDKEAAAKTFEELLSRYPDNRYQLPVYYQLYRIYLASNNTQKSEYYKNILLTKYPDSEYSQIIKNPNYYADKNAAKSKLELFYEETYHKYLNGEYEEVKQRKAQADQMYPGNGLLPRFDMLKTLAIGHTQPLSVFTASLQDIIRNYSTDDVRIQAQEILDYINGMNKGEAPDQAPPTPAPTENKLYTYNPDTAHYVIITFRSNGIINPDQLKIKLSDYNTKYYSTKNYTYNTLIFDHLNQVITIQGFENKQEAMLYYSGFLQNDEIFGNSDPDLYHQFVISVNNYPAFMRSKNLDEYQDFFRQFYQ
jgi:hypothetical protein